MFALCPQTNMLTQAPVYYRFIRKSTAFIQNLFCFVLIATLEVIVVLKKVLK